MKTILAILMFPCLLLAQKPSEMYGLDYVKKLEAKLYSLDYKDKTVYLNYESMVTDWDNMVVNSSVKIYRDKTNLNFFSAKANIFQDGKEMLLVLKDQKVILRNDAPEDMQSLGFSDGFVQMREIFFESCEVLYCRNQPGSDTWTLKLQAPLSNNGVLYIDKLTYTYDVKEEKIITTEVEFRQGYKIKKMKIKYLDLDLAANYSFKKEAWRNVLSRTQEPVGLYEGYELIDNRDSKTE